VNLVKSTPISGCIEALTFTRVLSHKQEAHNSGLYLEATSVGNVFWDPFMKSYQDLQQPCGQPVRSVHMSLLSTSTSVHGSKRDMKAFFCTSTEVQKKPSYLELAIEAEKVNSARRIPALEVQNFESLAQQQSRESDVAILVESLPSKIGNCTLCAKILGKGKFDYRSPFGLDTKPELAREVDILLSEAETTSNPMDGSIRASTIR